MDRAKHRAQKDKKAAVHQICGFSSAVVVDGASNSLDRFTLEIVMSQRCSRNILVCRIVVILFGYFKGRCNYLTHVSFIKLVTLENIRYKIQSNVRCRCYLKQKTSSRLAARPKVSTRSFPACAQVITLPRNQAVVSHRRQKLDPQNHYNKRR